VLWFTTTTAAAFKMAPELSVTVPVTLAVTDWPRTGEARLATSSASKPPFRQFPRFVSIA
jgi:hypothetical protein